MNAHRDQIPGSEWPEIPVDTPYLASYRKRAVCGDWMVETVGLELETHHPVIEPFSASRRERKFLMQRQPAKNTLLPAKRPILETGQAREMPRSSVLSAVRSAEV